MGDSLLYSKASKQIKQKWLQNAIELRGHVINESFISIPIDDIKKVKIPVLVIKGAKSPLYFRKIADELDNLLVNSKLYTLPNASHVIQGNNPEDFNKTVLNFIKNH